MIEIEYYKKGKRRIDVLLPFLYTISQSLLFPSKKLLPVIRICRIQCCRRVIACHTVLGYEGGDVGSEYL